MPRIELEHTLVGSQRLLLPRRILLQRNRNHKQLRGRFSHSRLRSPRLHDLWPIKREQELAGEWIEFTSLMPKRKPRAA